MKNLFIVSITGLALLLSSASFTQTATQPLGSGTVQFPYLINSLENLYWIAAPDAVVPNPPQSVRWGAQYLQITLIDASETNAWFSAAGFPPIGSLFIQFTGSYNGNGHLINNIHVNSGIDYAGLFGFIGGSGNVYGLQLISPTVHGNNWAGGIAGLSEGTISNCAVMGGDITGHDYVGGIAGQNENSISKCYTDINEGGSVFGVSNIGGIAGLNNGSLNNSYSHSTVTGQFYVGGIAGYNDWPGNIGYCFSTGSVSGSTNPGGLVGFNNFGSVNSSFWNIITSTQSSSSGGGTGSSQLLMQQAGTYLAEDWDFTLSGSIWAINASDNNGYPFLRWQGMVSAHIWLGTSSTDWSTAGNWSEGTIPNTTKDVVVAAVDNHLEIGNDASADCNNLTVETAASLTMESGGSLITAGDISNSGNINIKRLISQSQWHLIAIPTTGITANTFLSNYLQSWDETEHTWIDIADPETILSPGLGYALWDEPSKATTYTFTGTPLTGDQTQNISFTEYSTDPNAFEGANLLGNPYPSAIDWEQVSGYGAVYYWDGSAYVAWPAGTGTYGTGSRYIPPMQGFFIVANENGTFDLTNAMRTHEGAGSYYKNANKPQLNNGILLVASNGSYEDKLLFRLNEYAQQGFENTCDAWKLPSNTEGLSQLWSACPDGNLSIDVRPYQETIQLGFTNDQPGIYTIGIKEIADIPAATLEDTKTGKFHNLHPDSYPGGNYEFAWNPEIDDETRFKLHLNAVGIEETPITPIAIGESNILIYTANGNIYITATEHAPLHSNVKGNTTAQHAARVTITDIMGRILHQQEISGRETIIPVNYKTGVYIVTVENGNETKTEKVFIQ